MGKQNNRKLIKTKFEGVFYRLSSKKDPRTGGPDRVYYFWYSDADGKGHWKTVGRHSKGERPQSARIARAKFLNELAAGNNNKRARKLALFCTQVGIDRRVKKRGFAPLFVSLLARKIRQRSLRLCSVRLRQNQRRRLRPSARHAEPHE